MLVEPRQDVSRFVATDVAAGGGAVDGAVTTSRTGGRATGTDRRRHLGSLAPGEVEEPGSDVGEVLGGEHLRELDDAGQAKTPVPQRRHHLRVLSGSAPRPSSGSVPIPSRAGARGAGTRRGPSSPAPPRPASGRSPRAPRGTRPWHRAPGRGVRRGDRRGRAHCSCVQYRIRPRHPAVLQSPRALPPPRRRRRRPPARGPRRGGLVRAAAPPLLPDAHRPRGLAPRRPPARTRALDRPLRRLRRLARPAPRRRPRGPGHRPPRQRGHRARPHLPARRPAGPRPAPDRGPPARVPGLRPARRVAHRGVDRPGDRRRDRRARRRTSRSSSSASRSEARRRRWRQRPGPGWRGSCSSRPSPA